MTDIFLSYHNSDRAIAQVFADTLEARGWSVWWDREIPLGKSYDEVIEHELTTARCAIVLWSGESVRSRWVRIEASAAASRDCLLPVLIQDAPIPLEFRAIQTAVLIGWNGDASDPEFARLVAAIERLAGEPPATSALPQPIAPRAPTELRATPPAPTAPSRQAQMKQKLTTRAAIAAAALVVAAAAFVMNLGGDRDGGTGSDDGDATSDGSVSTSEERFENAQPVPDGAFEVAIGGRIELDVPGAGAGVIESPHSKDVYVFQARRGQRVYFHLAEHSSALAYIRWKLVDDEGTDVFDACLGCTTPGVKQLTRGGRYTLIVGSDTEKATGTYRIRLFDVPSPSTFAVKIGDAIREDVPARGAGVIESPGAEDVFTFKAEPRQRVYFRMIQHTKLDYSRWKLVDDDGTEVFAACLGCSEPGVHTLTKGGTYTLTVGNLEEPSTGTYQLRLTNVPEPDQFNVRLSDRIRPGVPRTGAGVIETPGAEDVYVFTASPGQQVAFRLLERDEGLTYNRWRLVDDNGMELFDSCFGCGEPPVQRLTAGGKYTLIVGNTKEPSTGAYSFELAAVR